MSPTIRLLVNALLRLTLLGFAMWIAFGGESAMPGVHAATRIGIVVLFAAVSIVLGEVAQQREHLGLMLKVLRAGGPGRRDDKEAIDILVAHSAAFPAMQRVFVEMSLRDPEVGALRHAFDELARDRLTKLIAAITPRAVVPDPGATAWVLYIASVECAAALAGLHGPVPVPPEHAKAALASVLSRALFPEDTSG